MKLYPIVLLCLLASYTCLAQKQNNNWCFGYYAGITFNTTPPSNIPNASISEEADATVSDRNTGELLFYTNNLHVYDRNHDIMPNGKDAGLDKRGTAAQGAVCVPFPNDTNKYYLFTLAPTAKSGYLCYSVVDMSLNNGLGDVDPQNKLIQIDSFFSEAMVAIPSCTSVWLVLMKADTNLIYAYHITDTGINFTPVTSSIPDLEAKGVAMLKASPNSKKLALAISEGSGHIGIADFDYTTGEVYNHIPLRPRGTYSAEFSPDSKRLYTSGEIYQYDLTQPTAADIVASGKLLGRGGGGLQLGPDSNIYITQYNLYGLDRITNANALYPDCKVERSAIQLAPGATCTHSLPTPVVYPLGGIRYEAGETYDEKICGDDPITLKGREGTRYFRWSTGEKTPTIQASVTGRYYVTMNFECVYITDTVNLVNATLNTLITGDSALCAGDTIVLRASSNFDSTTYLWNTGSTADSIKVNKIGGYSVSATFKDCEADDNAFVTQIPQLLMELGEDREICKGERVVLPELATVTGYDTILWSNGSGKRTLTVTEPGTYYVSVRSRCSSAKDTVTIQVRNCFLFFPNAFTPNSDGRNDVARMVGDIPGISKYAILIYNRWGNEVFHSEDVTQGWDGMHNGTPAAPDMYKYIIRYTYLGKEEQLTGDLMLIR